MVKFADFPESVEEAGALLGATITRCGKETFPLAPPPKGMHSSFAAVQPVPSSELLSQLHALRALLRSAPQNRPMPAAPSLLAGLMKLMGLSRTLAASPPSAPPGSTASGAGGQDSATTAFRRLETPPMLSTPIRKLWVDCVVLCHLCGDGLTGSAKIDTTQFIRKMLSDAGMNPRSVKAGGGVRIAALEVIAALFENPKLCSQLAPWSLEVLQLVSKALRSAGTGEPTYRVAAVRTACATAMACRQASLKRHPVEGKASMRLDSAMEDKALVESVKILKLSIADKFADVRSAAATFAGLLAPMLVLAGGPESSLTNCLEDVTNLAWKNLDDESPAVAHGWADAVSRCMAAAIQYNDELKSKQQSMNTAASRRDNDEDGNADGEGNPASSSSTPNTTSTSSRFGARLKSTGLIPSLVSVKKVMEYLADQFAKAGGELGASRAGGPFSTGGRAVRLGICLATTKFLRLQAHLGAIGEGRSISHREALSSILELCGEATEKAIRPPAKLLDTALSAQSTSMFGSARTWSRGDAGLCRLATSRVLREGLSEGATESVQISILQELIQLIPTEDASDNSRKDSVQSKLNPNQIQIIVIEVSHLFATLGEAAGSRIEEALSKLKVCVHHQEHGVRHEAVLACAAVVSAAPSEGRKLLLESLEKVQQSHAELIAIASSQDARDAESVKRGEKTPDPSVPHTATVHGLSLLVAVLIKRMPKLPGGLPCDLVRDAMSVAEIMISSQSNDVLRAANPGAVCHCVRGGFGIISGILATGPASVAPHIAQIFDAWQKASNGVKEAGKHLAPRHDLFCLDAVVSSVVIFLRYCSELLLSVPDALSQVSILLENVLPLVSSDGRLGSLERSLTIDARLESTKAAMLEAFAWLPSGSFPMAADTVSSFAAIHIREAIENDVACSILESLVSKEDSLLDSKSLTGARRDGQIGGAKDLEESLITLTSEVCLHGDREAVMYSTPESEVTRLGAGSGSFRGSSILYHFATDAISETPPTPLHEVGTWRRPLDPSTSAKVRLVDAAIQAFSATFGLKSGKEQQAAMDMLESLVPPLLTQLARTLGVNSSLTEQDRRSKTKEDNASVTNITAVLLSCLKALPLHESTHNVPIGLGPSWMNKAKDLLLTLLPSNSTIVRRATAEGLALLATVGVTEDAHFLQSTVLHSLDALMQGNKPDGKPRTIALEPVSAARAGSLLTLACIQRTAHNVAERKLARARSRIHGGSTQDIEPRKAESQLPVLQMMTRLLPSVSCHGFKDYFVVRTYALHSFAALLAYSSRLDTNPLGDDAQQLLRKSVELVEENFSEAWTAASTDADRGQELEKMTSEVAFLAVLLRSMTLLVPYLENLLEENPDVARRFCIMATVILETHGAHPTIAVEAMAMFEVLASFQHVLPPISDIILYSENPLLSCVPFLLGYLAPDRPTTFAQGFWGHKNLAASASLRAVVHTTSKLSLVLKESKMSVVGLLLSALEWACASKYFPGAVMFRSLALNRGVERVALDWVAAEDEICDLLSMLLLLEKKFDSTDSSTYLRWILLSRMLITGSGNRSDRDEADLGLRERIVMSANIQAVADSAPVLENANPIRWQVRAVSVQLEACALGELLRLSSKTRSETLQDPSFNLLPANKLITQLSSQASSQSFLVFHLDDVLSSTSVACGATQDQAELYTVQESSVYALVRIIECFGQVPDPEDSDARVLDQYSMQIFSIVKHSLGAYEEVCSPSSAGLFVAGCMALDTIIETELTTEPATLKRLARPIVPAPETLPLFSVKSGYELATASTREERAFEDSRSELLIRIAKLWASGKLLLGNQIEGLPTHLESISKALVKDRATLAVHSAAAAMDGARLLKNAGLSLVGYPVDNEDICRSVPIQRGFHYKNGELGDPAKALLAQHWSSFGSCCVKALIERCQQEEAPENEKEICLEWLRSLMPLFIAGIYDGLDVGENDSPIKTLKWANGLVATSILCDCLRGLTHVVGSKLDTLCDKTVKKEIGMVLFKLRESILLPVLRGESPTDPVVVKEICTLLGHAAANVIPDKVVLMVALSPLEMLQNGKVAEDSIAQEVVGTSLSALSEYLEHGGGTLDLVHALLRLVYQAILASSSSSNVIKGPAKRLLAVCLMHPEIDPVKQEEIVYTLASTGNWEAWASVANIREGKPMLKSLPVVQAILRNPDATESQVAALASIRTIVQSATVPSPLSGSVFHVLSGDILGVLYQSGSGKVSPEYIKTLCTDSIKIALAAYQQLISDDTSEEQKMIAGFLSLFFEGVLTMIRTNGLPNHPAPSPQSDSALGRMGAQTCVFVARTTPVAFKIAVASLTDQNRQLLEYSVRAEMTGYVTTQTQGPAKKKLALKSFKK